MRAATRRVRLTVVEQPTFEAVDTVPATRAECPAERPCPHVRCRYSLLRDDAPPGRPALGDVPRDHRGYTRSVVGDLSGGRGNPPALDRRAPWLSVAPSCALDVADVGAHGYVDLGAVLGRHRTLAARAVKLAMARFIEAGGTQEGLDRLITQEERKRYGHERR